MSGATGQGASFDPQWAAEVAGWYDDGQLLLLTHVPEPDFGEPMLLVRRGERVLRAEPRSDVELAVADGSTLRLHELRRVPGLAERSVAWQVGRGEIAGTLISPRPGGRQPAVVLVHGAAGGQRDFCRLFAQEYLEAGIATLVYDKPGHGRSGGPPDPTIFDQATVVSHAVDLLRAEPDVDEDRIGLAGFSNGMWAVPMVASARRDLAFVAGVGAPGVTMAESEIHRRSGVLRAAGLGADVRRDIETAWRMIFSIAARGSAAPELLDELATVLRAVAADDWVRAYEIPAYAKQNPLLSPIPTTTTADAVVDIVAGGPDSELDYDPTDDYRGVTCPVLLQIGELDTSVPARESARRIAAALAENQRATIRVYPGLEHMLNVPTTVDGLSVEETMHQFRDFRFGADVWKDLRRWLDQEVLAR